MKQKVNYIVHHKEAFLKLMEEDVTAIDISIYNTLFLLWNNAEFDDKLSINRNEVMMMSKVGNANTYTKSLRKLDELGFIKYFPSNNPMKGSVITMCIFDNSSDNTTDNSSGYTDAHSSDNTTDKGGDTLYKPNKLNKPLNSTNNKNIDFESENDFSQTENSEIFKSASEFFSQTTEILKMRMFGDFKRIENDGKLDHFTKQTFAYIEYKQKTKEVAHRWQNYLAEWESEDWIDKLKKKQSKSSLEKKGFEKVESEKKKSAL